MVRLARRLLSLVCWGACVIVTVFVVSFSPAFALSETAAVSTSPAVNVKYIHGAIKNLWDVDIPYSPELKSDQYVVNMRYLLGMVDIANARLGAVTTSYGTGEYATVGAVSKNTADKAIKTLIQKPIEFPFAATTTADTTTFSFSITASGTFYVDWGDGGDVDKYVKTNTGSQTISHTYTTAGAYTVRLGGRAKGYYEVNTPAAISFSSNKNLAGISGSLGEIFPTLADGSQPRFYRTFYNCTNLTGSIPEILFTGITGAPTRSMFEWMFYGCRGLTGSIPAGLFSGISGAPAPNMFDNTFGGCSGLTGAIPENLFAGISGAPASSMFKGTFRYCSGLTGSIPAGLFSGISGAPAPNMFDNTFDVCTGLTGSIPENLFAGISGAPASSMFSDTFYGCRGLTGSIPEKLFAGISGAPASSMFWRTFFGCSGLIGSIPEKLFGNIYGAPKSFMFDGTFRDCRGLTGVIPSGLFGNLSGKPAAEMFSYTFYGCSGLTGKIPEKLFGNIYGAPAEFMFDSTFYNCSGLTGSIPSGLFGNISGAPARSMFDSTFKNCSGLTGKSARNPDGTPLYEVFPSATSDHVGGMYTGTCLADNASIPTTWGKNANCTYTEPEPEYPFTATVEITSAKTYSLDISAAGTFYVNWGDGTQYEKIVKTDTTTQNISHTYSANGTYTVKLGGLATGYSTNEYTATIGGIAGYSNFDNGINVTEITGSLGKVFPTLADGSQPNFYGAFMFGQMKTIPAELFDGIHGAPVENMFSGTFRSCRLLTEIPAGLFSGIAGAPAENMFEGTFASDSALTKLPDGLFAGISGAPAYAMFSQTFYNCSGLTGSIPSGLFGNISGAPAVGMFQDTFSGCTGLTGEIPVGLFGNLSGSPAPNMFLYTFNNCSGLTGASARNPDGTPLYDVFPTATSNHVADMYNGTCFSDSASIPDAWGKNASCVYSEPTDEYPFVMTTTPDTTTFSFKITAAGTFNIDWGDGSDVETVTGGGTYAQNTTHTYSTPGTYTIRLGGLATEYDRAPMTPAISFASNKNLATIDGNISKIFPVMGTNDRKRPRFYRIFYECTNLTGKIPDNLCADISGAPGSYMYAEAFCGDTGLTGEIPLGLFGNLSGSPANNMFSRTFNNCSGLTGASARNPDGTPLYEVFPSATSDHVGGMYTGTCLADNASIPTTWGKNASCTYTEPEPAAAFTVTTVPNITSFEFILGASGSFTINWGDGNTEKITRGTADKTYQTVSHTYATAGTYTIGFSGAATEYPLLKSATSGENIYDPVAIYFGGGDLTCKIASMSGKLGNIFPTLADGSSPSFAQTFADCVQLTTIPADLFDGVTRDSGQGMFMATFADTAITEIPENLFATVSALGEESTFAYTFTGTKITTIPAGLFASITGDAKRQAFMGTFQNCKNLTEIPAGLFDSLNLTNLNMNADYGVFTETFAGCSSLTGPSAQTASGEYLYDVWSANYVEELANGMYAGDEGLDDYESMPDYLKEASE